MNARLKPWLKALTPVQLIFWTVVGVEFLTAAMSAVLGYVWWGFFSRDLILISLINVLVVSLIITPFVVRMSRSAISAEASRRSRELLQQSERQLQLITEHMNDVVWLLDLETQRFTYVSPSVEKLRGYTAEEVLAQGLEQAITEESSKYLERILPGRFAAFQRDTHSQPVFVDEIAQPCKDGTVVWTEVVTKYIQNPTTGNFEVLGVSRDISERRKAVRALQETGEFYQRAITEIGAVAYQRDYATSSYVFMTKGIERLTGYMSEELTSERWHDILQQVVLHDLPPGAMPEEASRLAREGKIPLWRADIRIRTKSGEMRWLEDTAVQLSREDGTVYGSLGILQDITARKSTEEAFLQAQKLESIGMLAGGVAHDFNNLLNAIIGHADLALRKMGSEDAARSNILKLVSAAERAADLTRQLLAYSGKGKFDVRVLDLNVIVRENQQIFEVSVQKNVRICLELSPEPLYIAGDRGQLQQVIMNLLINGAEAVGSRPGTVRITSSVQVISAENRASARLLGKELEPGEYACLRIADDGSGMDAKDLQRIFDPFFTTKFTGRGLGLAAVLGIITGHEGAIGVESTPGAGSTFTLYFPRVEQMPKSVDVPEAAASSDYSHWTVLVVDDEPMVRSMIVDLLSQEGIASLTAEDGIEAVEQFRIHGKHIDLVLLDCSMPRMGGEEALRQIRTLSSRVHVILSSGYSEESVLKTAGHDAHVGFIQKPYRPAHLMAKLRTVLQENRPTK